MTITELRELIQNSGLFDASWYMRRYPDVKQIDLQPLEHYVRYGFKLERSPGPGFDWRFYNETNPDIAKHKINPLIHYIRHGRKEGRRGAPIVASSEECMPDENGNLARPNRNPGNGREIMSLSNGRRHFWYKNREIESLIEGTGGEALLPTGLRRVLVVAHDMKLSTGVSRSISHYINAMVQIGGIEFTSVELGKDGSAKTLFNDINSHDFVVVNSLALFAYHDGLAQLLAQIGPHKSAIYLHETGWGFDSFQENYPERYAEFEKYAPRLNFLCVSAAHKAEIAERFGVRHAEIVYETTVSASAGSAAAQLEPLSGKPIEILMAGTIQPRKGPTLFSQVADLAAERGLPWTFRWAGWTANDQNIYLSDNVQWLGPLDADELGEALSRASVFFLSSADDPFPLACLEALLTQRRAIVYRNTGIAEILTGLSGTGIFEEHTPEAAFKALQQVVNAPIDVDGFERLNKMISVPAFVRRMNEAISTFWQPDSTKVCRFPRHAQKIAVVLHLFYSDLWPEFQSYLRNLAGFDYDLYVTLSLASTTRERECVREKILSFRADAVVLECENRGMDIGPFMEASRAIEESGRAYDLLLKIHSKKSLAVSGEAEGAQWRRQLLDGLIGSPAEIDRITTLFAERPEIGMVGPRNMLISKSSFDTARGSNINEDHMGLLAERMQLTDDTLCFFRGTMFWADACLILNAVRRSNLTIEDFDKGHQPDASKAHAMERLFPCVIRSAGRKVHAYDSTIPRSIEELRDREKGKDIYVIAAGASCNFVDPEFFDNKVVVAVNRTFKRYKADYIIYKEHPGISDEKLMLQTDAVPVVAKWHASGIAQGLRRLNRDFFVDPRYRFFDHLENEREKVDLSVVHPESDKLVVSYSTITSALHLAAHLGARNIIIVGHDCGTLDGQSAFNGYYDTYLASPWSSDEEYESWLSQIEGQTLAVKERIGETYGARIVSLNPFINFGLEGHVYSRALPAGS